MLDASKDESVSDDDLVMPAFVDAGVVSPAVAAWIKRKQSDQFKTRLTTAGAWSLSVLTCGALVAAAVVVVLSFAPDGESVDAAQPKPAAVVSFGSTQAIRSFEISSAQGR